MWKNKHQDVFLRFLKIICNQYGKLKSVGHTKVLERPVRPELVQHSEITDFKKAKVKKRNII